MIRTIQGAARDEVKTLEALKFLMAEVQRIPGAEDACAEEVRSSSPHPSVSCLILFSIS